MHRFPQKTTSQLGYLYKKRNGPLSRRKVRWFVLLKRVLYYYEDEDADKILGSISLASLTEIVKGSRAKDIELRKGSKIITLSAIDEATRDQWFFALHRAWESDRDTAVTEEDDDDDTPNSNNNNHSKIAAASSSKDDIDNNNNNNDNNGNSEFHALGKPFTRPARSIGKMKIQRIEVGLNSSRALPISPRCFVSMGPFQFRTKISTTTPPSWNEPLEMIVNDYCCSLRFVVWEEDLEASSSVIGTAYATISEILEEVQEEDTVVTLRLNAGVGTQSAKVGSLKIAIAFSAAPLAPRKKKKRGGGGGEGGIEELDFELDLDINELKLDIDLKEDSRSHSPFILIEKDVEDLQFGEDEVGGDEPPVRNSYLMALDCILNPLLPFKSSIMKIAASSSPPGSPRPSSPAIPFSSPSFSSSSFLPSQSALKDVCFETLRSAFGLSKRTAGICVKDRMSFLNIEDGGDGQGDDAVDKSKKKKKKKKDGTSPLTDASRHRRNLLLEHLQRCYWLVESHPFYAVDAFETAEKYTSWIWEERGAIWNLMRNIALKSRPLLDAKIEINLIQAKSVMTKTLLQQQDLEVTVQLKDRRDRLDGGRPSSPPPASRRATSPTRETVATTTTMEDNSNHAADTHPIIQLKFGNKIEAPVLDPDHALVIVVYDKKKSKKSVDRMIGQVTITLSSLEDQQLSLQVHKVGQAEGAVELTFEVCYTFCEILRSTPRNFDEFKKKSNNPAVSPWINAAASIVSTGVIPMSPTLTAARTPPPLSSSSSSSSPPSSSATSSPSLLRLWSFSNYNGASNALAAAAAASPSLRYNLHHQDAQGANGSIFSRDEAIVDGCEHYRILLKALFRLEFASADYAANGELQTPTFITHLSPTSQWILQEYAIRYRVGPPYQQLVNLIEISSYILHTPVHLDYLSHAMDMALTCFSKSSNHATKRELQLLKRLRLTLAEGLAERMTYFVTALPELGKEGGLGHALTVLNKIGAGKIDVRHCFEAYAHGRYDRIQDLETREAKAYKEEEDEDEQRLGGEQSVTVTWHRVADGMMELDAAALTHMLISLMRAIDEEIEFFDEACVGYFDLPVDPPQLLIHTMYIRFKVDVEDFCDLRAKDYCQSDSIALWSTIGEFHNRYGPYMEEERKEDHHEQNSSLQKLESLRLLGPMVINFMPRVSEKIIQSVQRALEIDDWEIHSTARGVSSSFVDTVAACSETWLLLKDSLSPCFRTDHSIPLLIEDILIAVSRALCQGVSFYCQEASEKMKQQITLVIEIWEANEGHLHATAKSSSAAAAAKGRLTSASLMSSGKAMMSFLSENLVGEDDDDDEDGEGGGGKKKKKKDEATAAKNEESEEEQRIRMIISPISPLLCNVNACRFDLDELRMAIEDWAAIWIPSSSGRPVENCTKPFLELCSEARKVLNDMLDAVLKIVREDIGWCIRPGATSALARAEVGTTESTSSSNNHQGSGGDKDGNDDDDEASRTAKLFDVAKSAHFTRNHYLFQTSGDGAAVAGYHGDDDDHDDAKNAPIAIDEFRYHHSQERFRTHRAPQDALEAAGMLLDHIDQLLTRIAPTLQKHILQLLLARCLRTVLAFMKDMILAPPLLKLDTDGDGAGEDGNDNNNNNNNNPVAGGLASVFGTGTTAAAAAASGASSLFRGFGGFMGGGGDEKAKDRKDRSSSRKKITEDEEEEKPTSDDFEHKSVTSTTNESSDNEDEEEPEKEDLSIFGVFSPLRRQATSMAKSVQKDMKGMAKSVAKDVGSKSTQLMRSASSAVLVAGGVGGEKSDTRKIIHTAPWEHESTANRIRTAKQIVAICRDYFHAEAEGMSMKAIEKECEDIEWIFYHAVLPSSELIQEANILQATLGGSGSRRSIHELTRIADVLEARLDDDQAQLTSLKLRVSIAKATDFGNAQLADGAAAIDDVPMSDERRRDSAYSAHSNPNPDLDIITVSLGDDVIRGAVW